MRRDFSRTDRVSQQIQREISMILQREMKDPRIGMVTVSEVDVSRDLSFAKVHVTNFMQDDEDKSKQSIKILNEASGAIRSMLAKRIKTRIVPELSFVLDGSLEEGMRISAMVEQAIAADDRKRTQQDDLDDEATDRDGTS